MSEDDEAQTSGFAEDAKGRGAFISYGVLGVILLTVLGIAWHLHAFWWQ